MSPRAFDVPPGSILTLELPRLADVEGFGGHVSLSKEADGGGDDAPELYFAVEKPSWNLVLHVHEGGGGSEGLHHYPVDLGPRNDLSHVAVHVGEEHVAVLWNRLSHSAAGRRYPYLLTTLLRLPRNVGFWQKDPVRLYCRADGLLSGHPSRQGSGYDGAQIYVHSGLGHGSGEGDGSANTDPSASTGPGEGDRSANTGASGSTGPDNITKAA